MKRVALSVAAALLQTSLVGGTKVRTREIGEHAVITGNRVTWDNEGFVDGFECVAPKVLSLSSDKKVAACCEDGNTLKGPAGPGNEFHCCADGHDLAGNKDVGFNCCPTGQDFDGKLCRLVCSNGKALVDGKCVCPEGEVEGPDGSCVKDKPKPPPHVCKSGLKTGKCYMFRGESGRRLAFKNGQYSEAIPHKDVIPGKFQLCGDEKCTPGQDINPNDQLFIRDLHGSPPDAADANQWLNNAANGAHIGKTPKFANAGNFTITKWPCGKYCLSGFQRGLGPACPAEDPSITFYRTVTEACVEYELLEVPCSIRDNSNNCVWKGGKNQCCGKVDCSDPQPEMPEPLATTTLPGVSAPPIATASAPAPPAESSPAPLCPGLHDTTRNAAGIDFKVLCGKYYMTKGKVEQKGVPDPLSCLLKCAADAKCQGANWDFAQLYCSHHFEWKDQPKGTNSSWVSFRPLQLRTP